MEEEEVRVPLSSWVRNCRKKLEHKKNNGTQLKGRRQFVIDVEPCPQALFMALCKLIGVESSNFRRSSSEVICWQSKEARQLDALLGPGWDRKEVLTDNVPDGNLSLNTKLAVPISIEWNKTEEKLQLILIFVLQNKHNVIVG